MDAETMDENEIHYWEPRVMRHVNEDGSIEFGIHDVYFNKENQVITYSTECLSPRYPTITELKARLPDLLPNLGSEITCGELDYAYSREDIEDWIEGAGKDIIDYM